jgi:predicted MFS family arabinose efflux permease
MACRPRRAASLLALIGVFDIVGTVGSGWLSDRIDPRLLLLVYYGLRGLSLLAVPAVLGPAVQPPLLLFVVFYGLDWVATVPPTVMLCREWFGPEVGSIVFGWVFASHQLGASAMAFGAGVIRDRAHTYDPAFYIGAGLCVAAALLSLSIRRRTSQRLAPHSDDEIELSSVM